MVALLFSWNRSVGDYVEGEEGAEDGEEVFGEGDRSSRGKPIFLTSSRAEHEAGVGAQGGSDDAEEGRLRVPAPRMAVAAMEPTRPPKTRRETKGKGAVRLGVWGSLSPMYSPRAKTVKIATEAVWAVHAAQVPCTRKIAKVGEPAERTAMGVMVRRPVARPRRGTASIQDIISIAILDLDAGGIEVEVSRDLCAYSHLRLGNCLRWGTQIEC